MSTGTGSTGRVGSVSSIRNKNSRIDTALAKTAIVEGEDVDARGVQLLGEVVPNFALTVALVQ